MTNNILNYNDYSVNKISEVSITHSLSQIETSLDRFTNWKASALSHDKYAELPLYDLDSALGQLDLIIQSKPSILLGKENKFALLLAQAALPPVGTWYWYQNEFNESVNAWKNQKKFTEQALPLVLVVSLHYLANILESNNHDISTFEEGRFALVASLSCYLYKGYPWADSLPSSLSQEIESALTFMFTKYPQYIDLLFSEFIRPAFVRASSHPNVSAAGRKIFRSTDDELDNLSHVFSTFFMNTSDSGDIWKTTKPYLVSLLEIYLHKCSIISTTKVQSQWSFFVPCILNIIDYHDPAYKRKGADLLIALADRVSPHFFKNTGVFSVFWDALKPALTFLPPSTPSEIAVPLSQSVFEAMIKLSYLSRPDNSKPSAKMKTSHELQEELLHDGIFHGISHAFRSMPMMIQFVKETDVLVGQKLKTYATPHLNPLIAIITGNLCDPFISFSTELTMAVIQLLQTVIRTLWFRVPFYRYDILRGIVTAANRINQQLSEDNDQIQVDNDHNFGSEGKQNSEFLTAKKQLSVCLELLIESVNIYKLQYKTSDLDLSNFNEELTQLQAKEPAFSALFSTR